TTGELTDALTAGAIDIAFMPADDARRQRVDFSPPYFMIESTYLVAGPTDIRTLADVDRPDVTVVGITGLDHHRGCWPQPEGREGCGGEIRRRGHSHDELRCRAGLCAHA